MPTVREPLKSKIAKEVNLKIKGTEKHLVIHSTDTY